MKRLAYLLVALLICPGVLRAQDGGKTEQDQPGRVLAGNLVYGKGKTSVCFAHHFLADVQQKTNIWTTPKLQPVKAQSGDLFNYPFVVMSGSGSFALTEPQRRNLRAYLLGGGFLVASPGCSSDEWNASFRAEFAKLFPDQKLKHIPFKRADGSAEPLFHTIYDIDELKTKRKGVKAQLEGLRVEGRVVMVYSPEGLNDTPNAGGNCCCCGGNEVKNARQVNANLLAYALTH